MESPSRRRAVALDALRGLAILTMILSGVIPHGVLPSWMYHAQTPPPTHKFDPGVPGITWVDLVFPFFLFALGAAIPLALSRRLEKQATDLRSRLIAGVETGLGAFAVVVFGVWGTTKPQPWGTFGLEALRPALVCGLVLFAVVAFCGPVAATVFKRGFLLGAFAIYRDHIGPWDISEHPTRLTFAIALLAFVLLFAVLARLPDTWRPAWHWLIRAVGWGGVIALMASIRLKGGEHFSLERSDIIIALLTASVVFGSLAWLLTRGNMLARLGLLGVLMAMRLASQSPGWVQWLNGLTPAPWIFHPGYIQYLFIVIPGTIAGDLILQWMRTPASSPGEEARAWGSGRLWGIVALMFGMVVLQLVGLKGRWIGTTVALTTVLCLVSLRAVSGPLSGTEQLITRFAKWGVYWLVLGLFFEPYEGGIKKDPVTMSYYFVTTGLALFTLVAFTVIGDCLGKARWLALLVDNGQNPMIAYVGISNLVLPILGILGLGDLIESVTKGPWPGFARGVFLTLLVALAVSFFTRRKIFWRT